MRKIFWHEPNRAKSEPLHIASRGSRYSTLTGVCWVDEFRFIVNHRDGLRIALFDLRSANFLITKTEIPHLTDDVALKIIGDNLYEVSVSGCWNVAYSTYNLNLNPNNIKFKLISTVYHSDNTFSHGVAYDLTGELLLSFHTGENPRVQIGKEETTLPAPWGPRDVCCHPITNKLYVVAVSENPKTFSYNKTDTSIWIYDQSKSNWVKILVLPGVHSDSCQIFKDKLLIPDQYGDRVLVIDLDTHRIIFEIKGKNLFSFPHGLSVNEKGILAVTNYGDSSIVLIDLNIFVKW